MLGPGKTLRGRVIGVQTKSWDGESILGRGRASAAVPALSQKSLTPGGNEQSHTVLSGPSTTYVSFHPHHHVKGLKSYYQHLYLK